MKPGERQLEFVSTYQLEECGPGTGWPFSVHCLAQMFQVC